MTRPTVEEIEAKLECHETVLEDHDEYGGSLGAAMNPDEEDAT